MSFNFDIDTHGVYYQESDRILINPAKHESLNDIINTIEHETIHKLLRDHDLDEIQEHWAIQKVMWSDEYFAG